MVIQEGNKAMKINTKEIYCRKMGHFLQFSYCAQEKNGIACSSIRSCWQYHLNQDNINQQMPFRDEGPVTTKVSNIFGIMQKVQAQQK